MTIVHTKDRDWYLLGSKLLDTIAISTPPNRYDNSFL